MEPAGLKEAVDAFNFDAAERMQTRSLVTSAASPVLS
jgi:hypothetical protein